MKNNNTQEFVSHNGRIIPKVEGSDYSLVNGKVYIVEQDRWSILGRRKWFHIS